MQKQLTMNQSALRIEVDQLVSQLIDLLDGSKAVSLNVGDFPIGDFEAVREITQNRLDMIERLESVLSEARQRVYISERNHMNYLDAFVKLERERLVTERLNAAFPCYAYVPTENPRRFRRRVSVTPFRETNIHVESDGTVREKETDDSEWKELGQIDISGIYPQ